MAVEKSHMVAAIDVIGPESAVLQMHVLKSHVRGIADVYESWTLCILVGAAAVPLTSNPELFPIMFAISVDGSLSGNGEAIAVVGIDEGGEVFAGLAFDAGFYHREVGDAIATFQFSAF